MVKRSSRKNNEGFIAIISLLIIATVSMLVAMTILGDGVNNASLSLYSIYYENARINNSICLEDTLMRIKGENQFSQNLNYAINDEESCTTVISWGSSTEIEPGVFETPVDLQITGTAFNFSRTYDYDLLIRRYDVNNLDGTVDYTNTININSIEEVLN